jgi:NhaP-type Na+/H+ or K+/H+ antiporter
VQAILLELIQIVGILQLFHYLMEGWTWTKYLALGILVVHSM